jgi:hypothetical protein
MWWLEVKGERRERGEEGDGDRDKGGRGETRGTVTQNQFENSRVAKNGHVRPIRQHPFQPSIMVSPRARMYPPHF